MKAPVMRASACGPDGPSEVTLAFRAPIEIDGLLAFFARRAISGVEQMLPGGYRRSLRLPHGPGVVELMPAADCIRARYWLADRGDRFEAVDRVRAMLDLDADPQEIARVLGDDELIGPLLCVRPGTRVPGTPDPNELAVRAVLGQQVSVAGAATLAGRLVSAYGEPLPQPVGEVTHLFPTADALANAESGRLALPASRRRGLQALTAALADGKLVLDPDASRSALRAKLLALPGIGPWTADYIEMRALRDPDAFPATDLGLHRALAGLGRDTRPRAIAQLAERWRPYRAYAFQHLLSLSHNPPRTSGGGGSARMLRTRSSL